MQMHVFIRKMESSMGWNFMHHVIMKIVIEYFLFNHELRSYFLITPIYRIFYQVAWKNFTSDLHCINKFWKIVEIYNGEFNLQCNEEKLRAGAIEANWFIFQISRYVSKLPWHRQGHNNHVDVEKICLDAYPKLKGVINIDHRWLNHRCSKIGKHFFVDISIEHPL